MRVRLNDHGRNVPDDVLKLLRTNGGIVMVTFVPGFLTPTGKATLGDVANHMDHARSPVRITLASAATSMASRAFPWDSRTCRSTPALTAELLRRGWPEEDIRKALGLNVLACDAKGRRGCGPSAEGARAVHSDDRAARSLIKSQSVADIRRAGLYGPPRTHEYQGA